METYFWLVELDDGVVVPQYDPHTGHKNKWHDLDVDKIRKIYLYPYTVKLLSKITSSSHDRRVANVLLPKHELVVPDNAMPFLSRDVEITIFSHKRCVECGETFTFNYEDDLFFVPSHSSKPYLICPNCNASDGFVCSNCNHFVKDTHGSTVCPICGEHTMWKYIKKIHDENGEERHTEYFIGYEKNGMMVKACVDEMGNMRIE